MFERLREFLNSPQSRVLQSLPQSGPVLGWTTALRRSGVRSATKLQQLGDKKANRDNVLGNENSMFREPNRHIILRENPSRAIIGFFARKISEYVHLPHSIDYGTLSWLSR